MTAPHIVALTEARDVLQVELSRVPVGERARAERLHEAVQVAQDDLDAAQMAQALLEMSGGFVVEQAAGVRP